MDIDERYRLAMTKQLASKEDLKAFVWDILTQEGLNPDIVNFKEEGIKLESLNKLVRAVYEAGYKDGLVEKSFLVNEKKRVEREGGMMESHRINANQAKKSNQVNKTASL